MKSLLKTIWLEVITGWPKDNLNRTIVVLELIGIVWMLISSRQAFKDMNRSLYNWKKPGSKKRRAAMTVTVKRRDNKEKI